MVWRGEDPIEAKATQRGALTFSQAMEQFLARKLEEFDNEKHKKQWRATLDNYAAPVIGDMLVKDVTVQDVVKVLSPIWVSKTVTAKRTRQRIESVLAWATVNGHRTGDNPAAWKGNLDAILPKPGKVAKVTHQGAIALSDAAEWFAEVKRRDGMATRALEFVALTAARSGEVRGATWDEIDLDAGLWVVPAERTKTRTEHRIPLPSPAVELLRALPRMQDCNLVFPGSGNRQLSDMSLSACIRRINVARGFVDPRSGRPPVPHGLRSTFRDWAAERGVDYQLAEISLGHKVGSEVERAYRRSDMVERRRAVLARWADFLAGKEPEKVVKLGV